MSLPALLGIVLAALFLTCSGWEEVLAAEGQTPLLMPGKKTLYQRVVSHPGARLFAGPEQNAAIVQNKLETFTPLYVYARQDKRLEVGVSVGKPDGWIDQDKATDWQQALTMIFTDRMGRMPVLFFRDHDSLMKLLHDDNLQVTIKKYAEMISKGQVLPTDFPVIAAEPDNGAVARKNFYLMPILRRDEQIRDKTLLLEVASINPGTGNDSGAGQQTENAALRTGFVFVIDTTKSMKPYIDQSLKLVRVIYDELEKNPDGDKMAFAVVAFRNDVKRTPGLGYAAQVVCDFKNVKQRKELEDALSKVEEATASSHSFNEEPFAGIKEAADKLNWQQFNSRVMLLISDAGPLSGNASTTGFTPETMAAYLKSRHIYPTVVHLKTPAGVQDHKAAENAYKTFAKLDNNQVSYLPIDASTPAKGAADFDKVGRAIANQYSKVVTATAHGQLLPPPDLQSSGSKKNMEDDANRVAYTIGYAMQLQFLGDNKNLTAPTVVKAWIADADLERLATDQTGAPLRAATPAVLLTKSQLSQLREVLNIIVKKGEESIYSNSPDFYEQVISAAAKFATDPKGKDIADTHVLGEFLDNLPYKSPVMVMTSQDWNAMDMGTRKVFLDRLKSLIALYDDYDKDINQWTDFGSHNPNEAVCRVPLTELP